MTTHLPRLSLLGAESIPDSHSTRRDTFLQAGGGEVLSAFMAAAAADDATDADGDSESVMSDASSVAQPSKGFGKKMLKQEDEIMTEVNATATTTTTTTTTMVPTPAAAAETTRRTTRSRVAAPTTTTTSATSRTTSAAVGKPPLAPRQAKLAEWKQSQAGAAATTAAVTKLASTSTSPLTGAKRKSMTTSSALSTTQSSLDTSTSRIGTTAGRKSGLFNSTMTNRQTTTTVTQGGSVAKKSRTSLLPPTSTVTSTKTSSPRNLTAGRKSMMELTTKQPQVQVQTNNENAMIVDENATSSASSVSSPSSSSFTSSTMHRVTSQWRLTLIRLQRSELTAMKARLEQAELAHASLEESLRQSEEEASQREASLQQQLSTSHNSESMLRLACEELTGKIEEYKESITQMTQEYEKELAELRVDLEQTKQDLKQEKEHANEVISTLRESESSLQQKLIQTEEQLRVVEAARYDDEVARKKLHSTIQDLRGSIRVFCRVRPNAAMSDDDPATAAAPSFVKTSSAQLFAEDLAVCGPAGATKYDGTSARAQEYSYTFDRVFNQEAEQATIYKQLEELIISAMDERVNVSCFAYGATGSGKTFTMLGSRTNPGMIPRAIDSMFAYQEKVRERGWNYTFKASLLEIYCEEIKDLLAGYDVKTGKISSSPTSTSSSATAASSKELKIQQDKSGRLSVTGLESFSVSNASEVHHLLELGTSRRSIGSTACNSRSSRSHTIFQIQVEGMNSRTQEKVVSLVSLIDLAGSERISSSGVSSNPQLLRETQFINSSLSTLITCMTSISSKSSHIPFRDSKLTHLLSGSMKSAASSAAASVGIPRTLFFINISPEAQNFNETLCTLRFAEKLKSVELNATPANSNSEKVTTSSSSSHLSTTMASPITTPIETPTVKEAPVKRITRATRK